MFRWVSYKSYGSGRITDNLPQDGDASVIFQEIYSFYIGLSEGSGRSNSENEMAMKGFREGLNNDAVYAECRQKKYAALVLQNLMIVGCMAQLKWIIDIQLLITKPLQFEYNLSPDSEVNSNQPSPLKVASVSYAYDI